MNVRLNNETGPGQILTDVEYLFGMSGSSVKVVGNNTNQTYTAELYTGATGVYLKNGELITASRILPVDVTPTPLSRITNGVLTLYINSTGGSDSNDGYTAATAKQTLLAALNLAKSLSGLAGLGGIDIRSTINNGAYSLPASYNGYFSTKITVFGAANTATESNQSTLAMSGINSFRNLDLTGFTITTTLDSGDVTVPFIRFMGGSFYWAHMVVKNLSANENVGHCFFVDSDSSVGLNEVAINNFGVGIRVQIGRINVRVIPDTSFTTTVTKVGTFINGWIGYAISMPLRADAIYTTLCNPGGSSFRFDYGKGIDGSKDGWVDVPFTLGSGFTAGSYFTIKYHAGLRAYSIACSSLTKTDISIGDTVATITALPAPPLKGLDVYGYGLDLFSDASTQVGRVNCGLSLDLNGAIKIYATLASQATGVIPNTKPGKVYGQGIYYLDG
jgi:hypothetical protein